jgi:hypothetical protein
VGGTVVSNGAPHFPQKRSPYGISALHFWHFRFSVVAQFKQMWVFSEF